MPKKQWQTNTKWIEIKIEKPKKKLTNFFIYKIKNKNNILKKMCIK